MTDEHGVKVERTVDGGYFIDCACGWSGGISRERTAAVNGVLAHMAAMEGDRLAHIYRDGAGLGYSEISDSHYAGLRAVFEAGRCDRDTIPVPRALTDDEYAQAIADPGSVVGMRLPDESIPRMGVRAIRALLARTKETTTDAKGN